MVSRSLLAGVGSLLVLWSFNIGVAIFYKHRELRIRGPRETLEVAIFVAGLASFGMLNIFDEPFLPCYGYMLWGLVPMVFVWPAFYLYITRYARLYHMHRLRAKSNTSAKSDATAVTLAGDVVQPSSRLAALADKAIEFSTAITSKQRLRTRVRSWLLLFVILASCLLGMYAVHLDTDGAPTIPLTYEDCRETPVSDGVCDLSIQGDCPTQLEPLWYMCFSVMLVEGGFFLILLFGTILDIGREASKRGDSLGIKTMLQRMGLDAALSMITFCVLVFAHFLGHLPGRWIFMAFVPFIISFYIDLTLIPSIRAVIAIRHRRKLIKENGLMDSEDLGKVMKIEDCKNPAELARLQMLVRLQAFIMTKEGYRTMHEHLAMEFGLESLLFVTEAVNYAADFAHFGEDADAGEEKPKSQTGDSKFSQASQAASSTLDEVDEENETKSPANANTGQNGDTDDKSQTQTQTQTSLHEQPLARAGSEVSARSTTTGERSKRKRKKNAEMALVPKTSVTSHNLQRKLRNPFSAMRKEKTNAAVLTEEDMQSRCVQIYFKFVHHNAPYQINIPASMLARFRGIGKVTRDLKPNHTSIADLETGSTASSHNGEFEATPSVFNDLILEVLSMVSRDSFQRYLARSVNRKLWDKFDAAASQFEVLTEVSSAYESEAST